MIKSKEDRMTQSIAITVCGFFTLAALIPFILLFIGSITDNAWAGEFGFSFFPGKWSIKAYQYIIVKWEMIGNAYLMTIIVTIIGTAIGVVISSLYAYGISKTHILGMKVVSFILIFVMLFNGGIVSTYYTYIKLWHIKNTLWALVVPGLLLNAFNVILIRNYYASSIPVSLEEAARIDGAGTFKIYSSIVLPLSKPILATIGLMTALSYWNDWINGLYYLDARQGAKFYTIQIVLNNINEDVKAIMQAKSNNMGLTGINADSPSITIRMAIAVVGILPILIAYPFFQKYFVKGITMGGVKE